LSSGPGKSFILGKVDAAIDGSVTIDRLSLSWTGPQRIGGLTLRDPAGQSVVSIASIDAPGLSLIGVIRGNYDIGEVTISKLVANVEQSKDGSSNIEKATKSKSSGDSTKSEDEGGVPLVKGRIKLVDSEVNITAPGIDPVKASAINGEIALVDMTNVSLDLRTSVSQGESQGNVAAKVGVNLSGESPKIKADVTLAKFPMAVVDRLAGMEGKLEALIGPMMDAHIVSTMVGQEGDATITVEAKNLHVRDATLALRGGDVTLDPSKPASVELNVTPNAWGVMVPDADATLDKPFEVQIALSKLRLPTDSEKLGRAMLAGSVTVSDIEMTAKDPNLGRLALRGTRLGFGTEELQKELTFDLSAKAEQGGRAGTVTGSGTLKDIVDWEGKFNGSKFSGKIDGRIDKAPMVVFDQVLNTGGMLVKALGTMLDGTLHADLEPGGKTGQFELTAKSELIDADVKANVTESALLIDRASRIKAVITAALVADYTKDYTLNQSFLATLTIDSLNIPKTDAAYDLMHAAMGAALELGEISMSRADGKPMDPIRGVTLRIATTELGKLLKADLQTVIGPGASPGGMRIVADVADAMTKEGAFNRTGAELKSTIVVVPWPVSEGGGLPINDLINHLVGTKLTGSVNATLVKPKAAETFAAQFDTDLTSEGLNVKLAGKLDGNSAVLNENGVIGVNLTPTAARLLIAQAGMSADDLSFTAPAQMTVTLSRTEVNFDQIASTNVNMKLEAKSLSLAGKTGSLIQAFVGESMTLKLKAEPGSSGVMTFDANLAAARLSANLAGRYDASEDVSITDGGNMTVSFTPESFAMLQPESTWQLAGPAKLKLTLSNVSIGAPSKNAPKDAPLDLRTVHAKVDLACDDLLLTKSGESQPYQLRAIKGTLDASNLASGAAVVASARLVAPGSNSESALSTDTTLTDLLDGNGRPDAMRAKVKTTTHIDPSPTGVILRLAQQPEEYADILGPTVAADITGNYPGTLTIALKSKVALDTTLNVDDQRRITLPKPAVLTAAYSPGLAKMLLKSKDAIRIDPNNPPAPIKVTLSKLDVPLGQLNMDAMGVKSETAAFGSAEADRFFKLVNADATVELGTITLDSESVFLLDGLMGMIERKIGMGRSNKYVPTQFTPLIATLREGKVNFEDIWIKAPRTVVGATGVIRPLTKAWKISAGISGETFQQIPGVGKLIGPQALVELHDISSKDEYSKKLVKIFSQLVASSTTNIGGLIGGKDGELIGGLIGSATNAVFKNEKQTLPWAHRPLVDGANTAAPATGSGTQATPAPATGLDSALPDVGTPSSANGANMKGDTGTQGSTEKKKDEDIVVNLLGGLLDAQKKKKKDK